jgi:hypothetical protein
MKIFAISVLGLLLVLAVAGCNPVGMDDTRVYVRGLIFSDSTHTAFAENIGVMTVGTQESYVTSTGANGRFWIEMQMYPDTGGVSGAVVFGMKAFHGTDEYIYGGSTGTFTVFGGDTLTMYDIDLDMFEAATKSGGSD